MSDVHIIQCTCDLYTLISRYHHDDLNKIMCSDVTPSQNLNKPSNHDSHGNNNVDHTHEEEERLTSFATKHSCKGGDQSSSTTIFMIVGVVAVLFVTAVASAVFVCCCVRTTSARPGGCWKRSKLRRGRPSVEHGTEKSSWFFERMRCNGHDTLASTKSKLKNWFKGNCSRQKIF